MTKTTTKSNANTFEINGETHELKLTWNTVLQLNDMYPGGSFEIIGLAIQGDMTAYTRVVFAALKHTGKGYSLNQVEDAIGELFDNGKISMTDVLNTLNDVFLENHFYKALVDRMLSESPEVKATLDKLRGK